MLTKNVTLFNYELHGLPCNLKLVFALAKRRFGQLSSTFSFSCLASVDASGPEVLV